MPWYTTADARRDAEKQSASKNRENSVRDNEGPSMNDIEREYRQLCRIDETPGVQGLAQLGRNAIERVTQLEKELAAAVAERDSALDKLSVAIGKCWCKRATLHAELMP